jgi:hypothetical protein
MRVTDAALSAMVIVGLAGCGVATAPAAPAAAQPAAVDARAQEAWPASVEASAAPAHTSWAPVEASRSAAAAATTSSAAPVAAASANPAPVAEPQVKPTPPNIRLGPLQYVRQTLNNCGPASIVEVLGFWGVQRSQGQAQAVLRPDANSRGMMPYPVPAYVHSVGMNALMGVGGYPTLVKALVANGFPTIVAQLVSLSEPTAHYREIEGYDDQRQVFISTDSYLGPNHAISYGEFDQLWARGNQRFIVIYPADKEPLLNAVLKSAGWDKKAAYQKDLDRQLRGENVMAQQPPGYYPPLNMPGTRELNMAWDYIQLGQLDQAKAEIAKAPHTPRNQQLIDWLNQDLTLAAA